MKKRKIYFVGKKNFFGENILIQAVRNLLEKKGKLCFIDGQSVKIKHLIFNKELLSREPNNKYSHLTGLKCAPVILQTAFWGVTSIVNCLYQSIRNKTKLRRAILDLQYRQIVIGDCIASSFLRSFSDSIKLNFKYLRLVFQVYKDLVIWEKVLGQHVTEKTEKKYFLIPERVYHDEALRRLLLHHGFTELRQNHQNGKLHKKNKRQSGKELYLEAFYSKKTPQKNMAKVEKDMRDYALGKKNYDYMQRLNQLTKRKTTCFQTYGINKASIIYLHAISDAQYIFGVSCFADLHDWLLETISICQDIRLPLLIKCNPAFFITRNCSPIDAMYVKKLEKQFQLSLECLPTNSLHKTAVEGIFFVSHKNKTNDLVTHIKRLLFLTHHGTVAAEAGYFGKTCIVSEASPYTNKDHFVHVYKTKKEYKFLIQKWNQEKLSEKRNTYSSLKKWCARRSFSKDHKNQYYKLLVKQYLSARKRNEAPRNEDPTISQVEKFYLSERQRKRAVKNIEKILQPCKI